VLAAPSGRGCIISVIRVIFRGSWEHSLTHPSSTSPEELIRACAESNDTASWLEFIARFHRPISLSIIRIAYLWNKAPRHFVDDLVQETYLKLCLDRCRLLYAFAQKHPEAIEGYVKMIATNVARDHFKAGHSLKRGSGEEQDSVEDVETSAKPDSISSAETIERQVLLKEIDHCLVNCASGPDLERDRTIFWLYYQHGMSAKAIAGLPSVGLTPKGVESAILRLTRLVREQMVRLRGESEVKGPGQKGLRPADSY